MEIRKQALEVYRATTTDDEPGRYALEAVQVHPDGTTAATDGCMLIQWTPTGNGSPGNGAEPFLISADDAKSIIKDWPKGRGFADVTADVTPNGETIEAIIPQRSGIIKRTIGKVDGKFPDYVKAKIIPRRKRAPGYSVALFLKALQTFKAQGVTRFTFQSNGPDKPCRLDGPGTDGRALAVIMPARLGGGNVT